VNRHTHELLAIAPRRALAARVLRIAARDNGSAVDIARVIQADPSLTARVLWLANSPSYGVSGKVASARHAVLVLGIDLANAIAVSAALRVLDAPGDAAGEESWRHAMATACAAAIVAPKIGVSPAEAFSAGLLHDVGATVLARRDPDAFAAAMASPSMADQVASEIASFGVTHADEGARLLAGWGMPDHFVEAVACHQHGVEAPRHALGLILRVAEAIALDWEPMAAYPTTRDVDRLLEACRLRPADLAAISRQLEERIRHLEASLGTARPLVASRDDVRRSLTTACSRALQRADAARLDPACYLQFAVDVVALLTPSPRVAASIGIDQRAIEVHAGERIVVGRRYPLTIDGVTVGALVSGELDEDSTANDECFEAFAALISRGLADASIADRLRRAPARTDASLLAANLSDEDVFGGLVAFARQLAAFPSAIGAELVVDDVAVGPPFQVRAGFWGDDGTAYAVERFAVDGARGSRITVRLRIEAGATTDEPAVERVLHVLAESLERIAHVRAFQLDTEFEPITGLGNRNRLQRTLARALDRAERGWEHVAVLLLDLEGYKRVNDEWGEEAGDAVLRACAEALRERTGAHDECIRLDGSEFVVVAPVLDGLDALRIADDVREEVARRCRAVRPGEWGLTATIGVALYPDAGTDPETLLRAADVALYRAKAAGRDDVMVAEPDDAAVGTVVTTTPEG
jgi:diguanylate cyclase (GGDEF)-like protein/putative nucleotidyltransferase with HDIG domain